MLDLKQFNARWLIMMCITEVVAEFTVYNVAWPLLQLDRFKKRNIYNIIKIAEFAICVVFLMVFSRKHNTNLDFKHSWTQTIQKSHIDPKCGQGAKFPAPRSTLIMYISRSA